VKKFLPFFFTVLIGIATFYALSISNPNDYAPPVNWQCQIEYDQILDGKPQRIERVIGCESPANVCVCNLSEQSPVYLHAACARNFSEEGGLAINELCPGCRKLRCKQSYR